MRIGIIGGGNISHTHARAAQAIPGVTVAAVFGTNRDRTSALGREFGAETYDNLDRFLDHRPMDLVAIGSPSGLHAEHGMAAAQRGLHVLVEKPIEVTAQRADDLIAAAGAAGVKLGVFFQDRLRPGLRQIKAALDAGDIGKPVMIAGRVKWYRPPDYYAGSRWRGTWALDGGGALMNQGIHTVDLMQWLFGPVARVQGWIGTRVHAIEVEDTAAAIFEFASGAAGTIEATTSAYPGYARRLEITGAKGTIVLEHDRIVAVDLRSPSAHVSVQASGDSTRSAASPVVSDASAHQRVLEDFIRAIETNGTPACDGRAARSSVELVEAVYASARAGRPVVPGERP
jgi:UDP-N-acetyl-2-amino-2-deoxyglucuronate dehydrogenase